MNHIFSTCGKIKSNNNNLTQIAINLNDIACILIFSVSILA